MPRIHPIEPANADSRVESVYEGARTLTGSVSNLTKTLAHSPYVLRQLLPFLVVLQRAGGGTVLDNRYKELAILKTSMINDCYG